MRIATTFLTAIVAVSLSLTPVGKTEEASGNDAEPPSTRTVSALNIGGTEYELLSNSPLGSNGWDSVIPGDSQAQIQEKAEADKRARDLLEREQRDRNQRSYRAKSPSPAFESDKTVRIIANSNEQCVLYARRITGNDKVRGYAGYLRPEGNTPVVGAVALEARYGHVSVVVAINGDYITLHDANWVRGRVTERVVPASTQRGYIY